MKAPTIFNLFAWAGGSHTHTLQHPVNRSRTHQETANGRYFEKQVTHRGRYHRNGRNGRREGTWRGPWTRNQWCRDRVEKYAKICLKPRFICLEEQLKLPPGSLISETLRVVYMAKPPSCSSCSDPSPSFSPSLSSPFQPTQLFGYFLHCFPFPPPPPSSNFLLSVLLPMM